VNKKECLNFSAIKFQLIEIRNKLDDRIIELEKTSSDMTKLFRGIDKLLKKEVNII